jgi:hypothetical protein
LDCKPRPKATSAGVGARKRNVKIRTHLALLLLAVACTTGLAQQIPDPDFDATVKQKTYAAKEHPRVVIDEAHQNFHTAGERYKPLAQLLINDGYDVQPGTEKFQPQTLRSVNVLIVANARGEGATDGASPSAFTEAECDIVRDWVSGGGSLLLIADHAPFGEAAAELSKRFGVSMGKGIAFDPANSEGAPTIIVFSASKGQLGEHPIIRGRTPAERVKRIVTFGGQSLSTRGSATALLKFGSTAYEAEGQSKLELALAAMRSQGSAPARVPHATPAVGRAQAVALTFGSGRVVIVGEAGMFSAQILQSPQGSGPDLKFGMNAPGNDDKQFALNVLHWLSAAL